MSETLYDTRFFLELYGSKGADIKRKLRSEVETQKRRYASTITIHEIYRITLRNEGRELAKIRKAAIERDFELIDIDSDIAAEAAEIKVAQGRDFPLADAIISATGLLRKLTCLTDDEHIKAVPRIKTRWL